VGCVPAPLIDFSPTDVTGIDLNVILPVAPNQAEREINELADAEAKLLLSSSAR
jgi:hypothetical protein